MTDPKPFWDNRRDGVSLQATAHPKAPWYKSLWLWLSHRDINPNNTENVTIVYQRQDGWLYGLPASLELVTPQTLRRDAAQNHDLIESAAANAFNSDLPGHLGLVDVEGQTVFFNNSGIYKWADETITNSIETQQKPTALRSTIAASLICWLIIGAIFCGLLWAFHG